MFMTAKIHPIKMMTKVEDAKLVRHSSWLLARAEITTTELKTK
jgi:hypothetical protein